MRLQALFVLKVHQIEFVSAVGHRAVWEPSGSPVVVLERRCRS